MSNPQYPQQAGQPQPGWGGPQQTWGTPPQPPKKTGVGKVIGLGCLGVVALFVVIGVVGAVAGGGGDSGSAESSGSGDVEATASATEADKPAADDKGKGKTDDKPAAEPEKKKTVVFKVWGTAPAGALGPMDITYGSDSDNREGKWADGKFEATLPLDDDALYYSVTAQLQGSGDIQCSVTVDGHTDKGHASGGYNICSAQANAGLLGGWD